LNGRNKIENNHYILNEKKNTMTLDHGKNGFAKVSKNNFIGSLK